jgi:uncharacterized repeat protein (TIGR03803 family)
LILSGNTLYGTASSGGTNESGTVFAVNTDGTGFKTLHDFSELHSPIPGLGSFAPETNTDGAIPIGGLVLSDDALYGTASGGGTNGDGTVFAVNTDGTGFTVLHTFANGNYGPGSEAGLVLCGKTLYGTTLEDTVFAINTDGSGFTTLHTFNPVPDGWDPQCSLVLSSNTLYGTADYGGTNGGGTVFAVNTDGTSFRVLYAFSPAKDFFNSDGDRPFAGLLLSGDTLYGTTEYGGTNSCGTVFAVNTDGTDFRLLHTFSLSDGANPAASLVLSGNTLYGTTCGDDGGDGGGVGTVFAVNTEGAGFTVIHAFNGLDGEFPQSSLLLSGNTLYGTTWAGGTAGSGTIFAITLPSAPAIDANSIAASGGQLQFVVNGLTPGATVYVQASSDLSSTGNWISVATNVTTGTSLTISGLSVTNANPRFFRALEAR